MKHVIIGTAGHVDHGKTMLVKALTGIDTDRLLEEKKRGITIELGFAHLDFDDGTQAGIVDVPGHEKLIRNMLAGAGGIDLAMLVVATWRIRTGSTWCRRTLPSGSRGPFWRASRCFACLPPRERASRS